MKRIAPMMVWIAAGSCTPTVRRPQIELTSFSVGGHDSPLFSEVSDQQTFAALQSQASVDLGCAAVEVRHALRGFVAEGCGKRELYVRVARAGVLRQAPGKPAGTSAMLTTVHFVSLSRADPRTSLADIERGEDNALYEGGRDYATAADLGVRSLIELNVQGASDLKCARNEVSPEIATTGRFVWTPMAEGCGRRATYLSGSDPHPHAFRLVSIVSLMP